MSQQTQERRVFSPGIVSDPQINGGREGLFSPCSWKDRYPSSFAWLFLLSANDKPLAASARRI
jgi:hypothetical protein